MNRIYHTWDKWECYPAGFYETGLEGVSKEDAETRYSEFLKSDYFPKALERVLTEWKNSCEHYLSNENMNRIAWLGQAAACIWLGLPSCYRGGFNLLPKEEQEKADSIALEYLNKWLQSHGEVPVDAQGAQSKTQANLY